MAQEYCQTQHHTVQALFAKSLKWPGILCATNIFLPHSLSNSSRRETKQGDSRGRRIILDLREENYGLVVPKEKFYENPNANTDWWNLTRRPKTSTRVINTRAQTRGWPLILKGQMTYSSLMVKDKNRFFLLELLNKNVSKWL